MSCSRFVHDLNFVAVVVAVARRCNSREILVGYWRLLPASFNWFLSFIGIIIIDIIVVAQEVCFSYQALTSVLERRLPFSNNGF